MVFQWLQTVTLDEAYEDYVHATLERMGQDRTAVERSLNRVAPWYLFHPEGRDIRPEDEPVLAEVLAEACRGWLKHRYRGRVFVVEILDPDKTAEGFEVRFYQVPRN